jgi:hypothetical protein
VETDLSNGGVFDSSPVFLTRAGFEGTGEVAMGWWEHLTPAQGTILGGLAVLIAGVLAFSTGWFDRRAEQRRFHYSEVKKVYTDALEMVQVMHYIDGLPAHKHDEVMFSILTRIGRVAAELRLTGNYETADKLVDFIYQETMIVRKPEGPKPGREIKRQVVDQRLRRDLAACLPLSPYARLLRRRIEIPATEPAIAEDRHPATDDPPQRSG